MDKPIYIEYKTVFYLLINIQNRKTVEPTNR